MAPGRPRARIELSRHRKEKTMNQTPTRRHDLDVLRILAVLLLIPFHSARVFDTFDPFYVKNEQTSDALSWAIVAFLNPWHMPLLFVLAGAATWFALRHRSPRAYAGERVKRLLVPFLFGIAVIVPPQAYRALLHAGRPHASPFRRLLTAEGDLSGYTVLHAGAPVVHRPVHLRSWRSPVRPVAAGPSAPGALFAMPLILAASTASRRRSTGRRTLVLICCSSAGSPSPTSGGWIVHRSWKGLGIGAVATMATVLYMNASGSSTDGPRALTANASEIFAEVNTWSGPASARRGPS
jgi:hypothetical protein